MTLWIILTIMTSAAAVLLSAPFIRRFDKPQAEAAGDIEVYRDQLKEVENERQQGLIDDAQAEAARLEINRRALAADKIRHSRIPALSLSERNVAAACVTGIVVLGSVGLYAATGNPNLPSPRRSAAVEQMSALVSRQSTVPKEFAAIQAFAAENQEPPKPQSVPPVDEMIRRLATRLTQNPKDVPGWRTLGWSYLNMGRFAEAADAYAKAIELAPNLTEIRSARIEALVRLADGIVTTEAMNAIEDTLKVEPRDIRARLYKALAKEQVGDKTAALADLREVLRDANPDEPLLPELKKKISELDLDPVADAAAHPTEPKSVVADGIPATSMGPGAPQMPRTMGQGPSAQDVRAAEAMPAEDRSTMIRGMVDRLATRLEKSPRDADGWIKLIQSRVVLGEAELAQQALARGIEAFNDDTQQRDRIIAAAQQLGLSQ
jgi:cytochrome c-type biogenesis protein CcmH